MLCLWAKKTTEWAESVRGAASAFAGLVLWMLSLSELCQVPHWAVKPHSAITQRRWCYHDGINIMFASCDLEDSVYMQFADACIKDMSHPFYSAWFVWQKILWDICLFLCTFPTSALKTPPWEHGEFRKQFKYHRDVLAWGSLAFFTLMYDVLRHLAVSGLMTSRATTCFYQREE